MGIFSIIIYTLLGNLLVGGAYLFISPTIQASTNVTITSLPTYWARGSEKVSMALEKTSSYLLTEPDKVLIAPITWIALLTFILAAFLLITWLWSDEKTKKGIIIWLTFCANLMCLEAYFA